MVSVIRTDSGNIDFNKLVVELDKDLAQRNGEDNAFFAQFNNIDVIKHVVVAYVNNSPVGCGAFKPYDNGTTELKRMFVLNEYRGRGVASAVLSELEKWAGETGFNKCVLETGKKQPEAIGLYKKYGYNLIPNFGQYAGVEDSVCFEKAI